MRVAICALRAAAEEVERHSTRKEFCDAMKQFHRLLQPLAAEYRLSTRRVVPPAQREHYDEDLKLRLLMQANKACVAHPEHARDELEDLYEIFAELQEQYCVSTAELERAA